MRAFAESMSLVDLDFGNKVPAQAAPAVAAAAAARNYVVKPRLGMMTTSLPILICFSIVSAITTRCS
jgi:hypothetical protein